MEYTVRQLKAEIADAAAQLDPNHPPTGLSKLRKAELELLLTTLRSDLQDRRNREAAIKPEMDALEADIKADRAVESVNETIDGYDTARRWLDLHDEYRTDEIAEEADRLAAVPSPRRDYQSSQEALSVLRGFLGEFAEQWDDPTEDDANDAMYRAQFAAPDGLDARDFTETDPEFAAEVDALVARELAADPIPETARRVLAADLPVTETNVGVSDVAVIVQSGSKLIWGKLISVVNRRTRYSAPFLCTVELESGVRQLVAADDVLAA